MDHGPITRVPDWQLGRLDLDAYQARTGYDGPLDVSTTTLEGLYDAHQDAIPFENVTALLGGGVPLGLDALQAKMVRRRRGGYCHEHVLLFAGVLERLGFPVARLAARVQPRAARALPRTHLLLVAAVDGRPLVCDIGFGAGVLGPLPLAEGTTRQGGWRYRLQRHRTEWLLSGRGDGADDDWDDLHTFTEEPLLPADVELANHFVATSPHSPFARRLIVMRVEPAVRRSLLDRTLTTEHVDGRREEGTLEPDDALAVLRDTFDVHLDGAEEPALRAHLAGVAAPAAREEPVRADRPQPDRDTTAAQEVSTDAH